MPDAVIRQETKVMFKQRARDGSEQGIARSIYTTLLFTTFLYMTSQCFADQLLPLTIERPPKSRVQ
jgi:hypothetical protein